jgi:hypothetical protein
MCAVSHTTSVFVGRERELRALRAALADVLRDRGALVLLSGEPGIGKSRLADEIALEASEAGAIVVCVLPDVFRREGEYWAVAYQGDAYRLKHSKGPALHSPPARRARARHPRHGAGRDRARRHTGGAIGGGRARSVAGRRLRRDPRRPGEGDVPPPPRGAGGGAGGGAELRRPGARERSRPRARRAGSRARGCVRTPRAPTHLRRDHREIVFDSDRPRGLGGPDVWSSTRTSTHGPWSAPANLGPSVNSAAAETRPSFADGGLTLYFGSTRPGSEPSPTGAPSQDIHLSTREQITRRNRQLRPAPVWERHLRHAQE